MRINYNVSSIIARNALNINDTRLSNSIQRLSSGLKINSAADDSAGLAISLKMNAQIKGLEQANQNANDGVSVVNTADGAMSEMHDILQRMNELAIQSANGTNSDSDREQIQLEIDQLVEELDRIAETTQFNAQNLLDGTYAYKGYSNTENVKVMSYSDGVSSGTYSIKELTYYHYEDTIKDHAAYIEKSANGEVTHEDSYAAASADDIKEALVTEDGAGIKGFPEGSKVIVEDEHVIIEAENDFKVKLSLNDRSQVAGSGVTTTSTTTYLTTDCYKNITVTNQDGTIKYNISELNIIKDYDKDETMTGAYTVTIHTGSTEEGLRHLTEDFEGFFKTEKGVDNEYTVTACSVNETNGEITIKYENVDNANDKGEYTFKLYQEGNKDASGKVVETTLDDYLHTHTDTVKTTYKVGDIANDDQNINLNLTGMGPMRLQVGANEGQVIQIEIPCLKTEYLGVDGLDITTEDKATAAIDTIGDAINQLSSIRAKIGAYCNRIEHTITNLDTTEENMTASYSRIMDVDMATEMTEYSTVQVLVESATSMLAQANERPQSVLQLLQ